MSQVLWWRFLEQVSEDTGRYRQCSFGSTVDGRFLIGLPKSKSQNQNSVCIGTFILRRMSVNWVFNIQNLKVLFYQLCETSVKMNTWYVSAMYTLEWPLVVHFRSKYYKYQVNMILFGLNQTTGQCKAIKNLEQHKMVKKCCYWFIEK